MNEKIIQKINKWIKRLKNDIVCEISSNAGGNKLY